MTGLMTVLASVTDRTGVGAYVRELKIAYKTTTRSEKVLLGTLSIFLFVSIILPIIAMIFYSFAEVFPTTEEFSFTVGHYAELFSDSERLWNLSYNTLIYSVFTALIASGIGLYLSIYFVKYSGSKKLFLLVILPYAIPSISAVTGWVLLFGSAGLVNRTVVGALGLQSPPFDIYSLWGMVWVEALHMAPIAFLLITPALRSIPASMDEASYMVGAGKVTTYTRVIVPVIWPTIVSCFVFIFVRTLATVATPSVLGVPEQIYTFGSAIPFLFLSGTNINYSLAFAFSVFITALSALFILYYMRVQAREGRYTTITGQGQSKPFTHESGPLEKVTLGGFTSLYLLVGGILPILTVVWSSLLDPSVIGLTFDTSAFTLENWANVVDRDIQGVRSFSRAFWNTILLAVAVPTIVMLSSLLIAYANQTIKMPFGRTLSFLASVPLAIPGVSLGLGFLAIFVATPIYGTIWILFIAFIGMIIPVTQRYASPALTKIGKENTEASLISGDSELRSFAKITFPSLREDYIAGWIHGYANIIRAIPVPILLYAPGSEVLAVELLNILRAGFLKPAATLAVLITIISTIPFLFMYYLELNSDSE